jgi:proteasome assembly chaperone (PAC2) family protein
MLSALLGASAKGREEMLEESFTLSLRSGKWKYIAPFNGTTPGWLANKTAIENGLNTSPQLFDITIDWQEKMNLAAEYPEVVKRLQQRINAIKAIN